MIWGLRLFVGMAGVAVCVLAVPALAQTPGEAAREAIVDLCPELMLIKTPLAEDARIKARGFVVVDTRQHPRASTLDIVSKKVGDGEIWIANSREGSFCQVSMLGTGTSEIFQSLLKEPGFYSDGLYPDPASKDVKAGIETHEFRAPSEDGLYYGIQFVNPRGADPVAPLVVQQYAIEEE